MTKQKESQKKKETLYTKNQIINSQKYKQYKDLLTAILEDNNSYSSKQVDVKIKEFFERKV